MGDLFTKLVVKFDNRCQSQRCEVVLIIDNYSAHPKIKGLQAITLHFLPSSMTSRMQVVDQGIIRTLQHGYRGLVIGKHLWEELTITLLDAVCFLKQAWHSVRPVTIPKCYARAGFRLTDGVGHSIDNDDLLDDIPLAGLIDINVTMDDYIAVDNSMPTCHDITVDSM